MRRHLMCVPILLLLGACHAARLSAELSQAEMQAVRTTRLPYRVGVERDAYPAYSRQLIEELRRTGVFREVADLDSLSGPPHLIARVEDRISGCAVIPVLTALTLGIIPTICTEPYGTGFTLRAPGGSEAARIALRGEGPVVLGWGGGLLSLLPSWSSSSVRDTKRYGDHLAHAVVQQALQIQRIAASGSRGSAGPY